MDSSFVKKIDSDWEQVGGSLEPAHKKYGFGSMDIGEILQVDCEAAGIKPADLRSRVCGYSSYHGKKFKIKTRGALVYLMRIQ